MTPTVNIILPTIRFLPVTQDIIRHMVTVAEDAPDLHVTIADGQEDDHKKEWILRQTKSLANDGRFTYIGLKDVLQRTLRAVQVESEWILPLSDDDPFSVNFIRTMCGESRTASSDTMAIAPSAYLSYSSTQLHLFRLKNIGEQEQTARLLTLYNQAHLNGVLTWSVIRRTPFLEWFEFLLSKAIWPSYADQLLVSYLAMKGNIVASKEESFYAKDERDWHDPRRAIIKDSESYTEKYLTLFHEIFWSADLFTLLRSNGLEDTALPSLTFRTAALLQAGASTFENRLRVLGIDKSNNSEQAYLLVMKLAAQAASLIQKPLDDHLRFFMQVQSVAADLRTKAESATDVDSQPCGKTTELTTQKTELTSPVVSVVIPCYNQAHYLPEAVESVVAQTFHDWECVIVNDGSPDETSQVARELIARYPDKIRLLEKANGGLADARNAGIASARGRYILPLDADDALRPEALARLVEALETQGDIAVAYSDYEMFGARSQMVHTIRDDQFAAIVPRQNGLPYCSLYRREVWLAVGGYNRNMIWGYEDWDFWVGCVEKGFNVRRVPEPLFLYRVKSDSMYSNALKHDAELKAQIVLNHPMLYDQPTRQWAEGVLDGRTESVRSDEQPSPTDTLSPDTAAVNAHLQRADERFAAGDLAAARDALLDAIRLAPGDPQLIIAYGNILLRLGDAEGARHEFVKATKLAPDDAPGHLNLAAVLLLLGQIQEAETTVRRALELQPADADALKLLGRLCFESGRGSEGIKAYTEALRQRPDDVETLLVLGKCAVESGEIKSAKSIYERALQIDPNNEVARDNLKIVKDQTLGEVTRPAHASRDEPQPPVRTARPLPNASRGSDSLRLLMVVHGFPPKAFAGTELYTYALAQELRRRGHTVWVLCADPHTAGPEGAITEEHYEGLTVARIHVGPTDLVSQFNNQRLSPSLTQYVTGLRPDMVHIQHLIGVSGAAVQVFQQQALPVVMTLHDGWLLCEQCHFLRADGTYCKDGPETVDKCVHCFSGRYGLASQSERIPEVFYALALRRQFLQKTLAAVDTLVVPSEFMRQALTRHGFEHQRIVHSPLGLPPFSPGAWKPHRGRLRFTFLGNICFTKGADLAVRAFNLVDARKGRLDLYGRVQDPAYFRRVMASVEPAHQVHYHGAYMPADLPRILAETDVAVVPSRSEHYPCTVRECLHAGVPVIGPNVGAVHEIMLDKEEGLLFTPGDYEDLADKMRFFADHPEQITCFRRRIRPVRTISDDADRLEIIYRDTLSRRAGVAQHAGTEIPTAMVARDGAGMEAAAGPQAWPTDVVVQVRQAEQHVAGGDLAAARQCLDRAVEILPDELELTVALGNVLLRLGDIEAARREFTKAAVLHPEHVPAHTDLAVVLLHLGRAGEAESSARQALALEPTNLGALKVLARICLDSERYAEAVQAYVTILQQNPDDVETLLLVGNCYAEAGRPEDAKAFYRRALALDPGNAVATDNLAAVDGTDPVSDARDLPDVTSEAARASIIIVTYNSARTIRACLDSVLRESGPAMDLIVVDNVSTDKTRSILREYQGRITTILNSDNVGFSAACNQGIRASAGAYVVLLNPDTVVTPGWVDRLIGHVGPGIGAVGPVSDYVAGLQKYELYDPERRVGRTVVEVAEQIARANRGRAVETKLLIGFCLMVPRRILDDVGMLDEALFLGNDDLDLSWRLREKGYRLVVATDTFIHHEGQASFKSEPSTKTSRLVQESTDRLYAKLEAHYGVGKVPSPVELWGITWFKPTRKAEDRRLKTEDSLTPPDSRLTSIIILAHNGLEHTEQCLQSIEAHTPERHELIIVDNASTDGTLDSLRNYMATRDNVRVIANRSNRGFAAGNNQGLALARGEYVLLLNNDTIVTEGWLTRMQTVFGMHPDVGIVGPVSNYVSGPQLVHGAAYKDLEGMATFAAEWARTHDGQSQEATRVVGFCLLMRKEVVARVGGLDERFGSGNFEDDDLCIRAFQIGFRARIALDVFIHHTGSQTFKATKIDYRQSLMRNWELFKAKWGIPADRPYEQGYHFPPQGIHDSPLSVPLPDIGADHRCEVDGRWWQELGEDRNRREPAVTEETRFRTVIVPNGHGLAPLWSSLVQHTNYPLAITIVSPTGSENGSVSPRQSPCPEDWQVTTADVSQVRLLNELLRSVDNGPIILLSSELILTPGWLKRLLAAVDRDPRIAAVGPTLNHGQSPQQVKADYRGTGKALRQFALRRAHRYGKQLAVTESLAPSCLVFKPAVCRAIGALREDLDLAASLADYVTRLRTAGSTVAVVLDAYAHCDGSPHLNPYEAG